jgi:hypothetical protein
MREELKPRVNVCAKIFDAKSGTLISEQETHNLVVDTGLNLLRDALYTGSISPLTKLGIGLSGTVVSPTNTALFNELLRDNLLLITVANKSLTCQYFLSESAANGQTLRELGLFTTDGTMYARVVLPQPINKTNLITASFVWTLDWGSV